MSSIRQQRLGWYLYDFANSGFSTSVITVFFGPYLDDLAQRSINMGHRLTVFGMDVHPSAVFSFAVAASVIIQVVFMPLLGAYIDATHRKRFALLSSALIGSLATMAMYWLHANHSYPIALGVLLFILANVAFGSSIVASNSFLNDLATVHERDRVSSRGWAFGYLGGGLLLVIHLYMLTTLSIGINVILASTGIWWMFFTLMSVSLLRDPNRPQQRSSTNILKQTLESLRSLRDHRSAYQFLIAYLCYNETVQAAIAMAGIYGKRALGIDNQVLVTGILMVQFVALIGALAFNKLAERTGTLNAILISIVGWLLTLLSALVAPASSASFYILAAALAIVLGGIQALSRSYFSTLIPSGTEAEYFALYEISDKGTSWIGPVLFGIVVSMTGDHRIALVSLVVFLMAGAIMLTNMKRRGIVS